MMMGLEVLLLIGVVAAVIWAVQRGWAPERQGETKQSASALDSLEKRYAQGEIDREEFQERRAMLGS